MSTKTDELMQNITDAIIKSIEAGQADGKWVKPWSTLGGLPCNVVTGKTYQGGNLLWLMLTAGQNGWSSSKWATYKQWASIGAQVRKGEKGTMGIKWIIKDLCKAHPQGPRCPRCSGMFPSAFTVFNAAQVDGFEEAVIEGLSPEERIDHAEIFFGQIGAQMGEGDSAYYSPALDTIVLPRFEAFTSAEAFYATMAHEHIHWTGHSDRLARDLSGRFGSEAYGAEELIAELGAAILCAQLGITDTPREDHAIYLASWLRIIKADPKALWTAAGAASKAVEHLLDLASVTVEADPSLV